MKKNNNAIICLIVCLLVTFASLFVADRIQKDLGNVDVTIDTFEMDYETPAGERKTGTVSYKLYVPKSASSINKAPALLMLHGYQNDHETDAAYAIEMARRGVVVMCIDEFGHGATNISMVNRGYVNHRVTVNYGLDSEEDGTFISIGGQTRYKVLMNFSNLSFFIDRYTEDEDGNRIYDSSMGGIAAYKVLSEMDFVNDRNMAISGHSMGTWASWTVAAAYSGSDIEPRATILQCGELFSKSAYEANKIRFNNVLLLTSKYDEFNYFRDFSRKTVDDDVIRNDLSSEFLNCAKGQGVWNKTYGKFADGSARRRQLLITNHRLATHDHNALTTSIEWLNNAFDVKMNLSSSDHIYMIKEVLVLVATLSALVSLMALFNILINTPVFADLAHPELNEMRESRKGGRYWKGAFITILIGFITYPFCTQLGHGLLPLPDTTVFRMTIGNGFLSWYLILVVIMLLTTIISKIRAKKNDEEFTFFELGMATDKTKKFVDFKLFILGLLLAVVLAAFMYGQCFLAERLFMLDFRFIWPFFKSFDADRIVQFLIYIPVFLIFFLANNSKIFAQNQAYGTAIEGFGGFIICWFKNALCMIGGVLLLILLEYIPFFMGIGPGADLLFSSTFGGPFMSLMIVFVPQVLVFSLICTHMYRKTGSVFAGASLVAILACWIVTGGSAIL